MLTKRQLCNKLYHMNNRDKILQYKQSYYINNKDIIQQYKQSYMMCVCSKTIKKSSLTYHKKSRKHIFYMNYINRFGHN